MPGGGDSVGGGVWETNDRRETFIPGATEGKGTLQGVRGRDGDWVAGESHVDATWELCVEEMELGIIPPWRETTDIPYGLPDLWRTTELTS